MLRQIFAVTLIISISFLNKVQSQISYRDTLLAWNHFEYSLDDNNGMENYSTTNIVEQLYNGLVIENEYVRLVILPEFGARIISFYYKPTGHEQFYTNPVGTPYGMGDGNFYYDWLMVFGGVFPTFPEPEHGKTWFLPWVWEFTEISNDRISLQMQLQDTINFPYHPGKFNNGLTGLRCISTVTLESGKTSFDFKHTIENTQASSVAMEYWTCTTLAPGSETGNTFTPANAEIVVPIDYIYVKNDWWPWMGNVEAPASGQGSHVFEYNNLAWYENWDDMGIAYAYPSLSADFYGVINHNNKEGVFRVADNAGFTPGMKFWTWGADQGLGADPEDFYDIPRPYIELWSGLSTQFFEDYYLAANESIEWVETYMPTVGMQSVSGANENAAIYLEHINPEAEIFNIEVFTTSPGDLYQLELTLQGNVNIDIYNGNFIAQADQASIFSFSLTDYVIDDGDYLLAARLLDQSGELALEASIPTSIPLPVHGINALVLPAPNIVRLNGTTYMLEFDYIDKRMISIYTMNGQLISEKIDYGNQTYVQMDKPGIYILRIAENNQFYSIKIAF